ncbi:hypothetical protein K1719_000724 [Acacia pycnantha]|nr:hypothetical protein K1719_000724 [Acacia pycnantha]
MSPPQVAVNKTEHLSVYGLTTILSTLVSDFTQNNLTGPYLVRRTLEKKVLASHQHKRDTTLAEELRHS